MLGEITALEHEIGNYTVESRALVPISILAGRELAEVPCRLGDDVVEELDNDAPCGLTADRNIKL